MKQIILYMRHSRKFNLSVQVEYSNETNGERKEGSALAFFAKSLLSYLKRMAYATSCLLAWAIYAGFSHLV